MNRLRLSLLALGVAILGLAAVVLAATPTGRAHVRAGLLVADLLAPTDSSILRGLTAEPQLQLLELPGRSAPVEARYYRPASDGPHSALILVLGYPSNIDDRDLNQVAENLARLGVAAIIPRLPDLREGLLAEEDVTALVDTFEWASTRPELRPGAIGFGGFCVGSSLALLAAEDPAINDRVALVNVFGGYYDLRSFMRAAAARSASYQGEEHPWQPAVDTETLLVRNVLHYLGNPEDTELIRAGLSDENSGEEPLTESGRWALEFLAASDNATVDELMDRLPAEGASFVNDMSPGTRISQLKARLYIMHDRSDPFVPIVEAYRLADAAPDPSRMSMEEFVLFSHVRPDAGLQRSLVIGEAIRLLDYLAAVLGDLSAGY